MMKFQKATRKKAKLRLALCGPSGSGKTFSALLIAKGIGGKVAMIDTERGSGELYADNDEIGIDYDVLQLEPPYSPQRYVEAIKAARDAGYDVAIVDSLTHMWSGEGGLLEMVDAAAKSNRGNSFAGWKAVRPQEKKALDALTGTPIHIIATMRVKTGYDMEKDEKTGKTRPVKVGLKPEQREGLEYEFTVVFDLSVEGNIATASKDRTSLFRGQYFVPSAETGKTLASWLDGGVESPVGVLRDQIALILDAEWMDDDKRESGKKFLAAHPTEEKLRQFLDRLETMKAEAENPPPEPAGNPEEKPAEKPPEKKWRCIVCEGLSKGGNDEATEGWRLIATQDSGPHMALCSRHAGETTDSLRQQAEQAEKDSDKKRYERAANMLADMES